MEQIDFRNQKLNTFLKILDKHHYNSAKMKSFRKAFYRQNPQQLTDLKGVRKIDLLARDLPFQPLKIKQSIADSSGTEKFIIQTHDQNLIETVLMPDKKNVSLCVSSQVGCRFGCTFCNTGKMGFIRNLSTHEILEQIRQVLMARHIPNRLACISFMGMGEPLDNLDNVMLALEWIESEWGYLISRQRLTFSTSGVISLEKLFQYQKLPNLAISLHTANPDKRAMIMPKARIPLARLKKEMREYTNRTGKQISVEYCLFKGFNDNPQDIEQLLEYLAGLPCKINLLNYNPAGTTSFQGLSENSMNKIKQQIKAANMPVIYRRSLGTEVGAGCGQLGGKNV
ncbi:MAG: 23S rRNA (adenine(2503)-C(2))-methyltransferase RlmN [Spirochaetes bacterium]|nr:23S rRNA (adenine(2503)-C(2))-methyltransferase RlmN [Spirochaetota bacterium]